MIAERGGWKLFLKKMNDNCRPFGQKFVTLQQSHKLWVDCTTPAICQFPFQRISMDISISHGFPFISNSRLEAVDVVGAVRLCELVAGREGAEADTALKDDVTCASWYLRIW